MRHTPQTPADISDTLRRLAMMDDAIAEVATSDRRYTLLSVDESGRFVRSIFDDVDE